MVATPARKPQARNQLHELGYKIFLDRYAQKDMNRTTLAVGDTVIVVVDSKTGQREIGRVTTLDLPQVTIELNDGEIVTRDLEHVDKPLETDPAQMMSRVAKGIAQAEKTPKLRKDWTKKFEWLLDDFKFVPAGRILTAAGTDQLLTFYNCMPPDQEILTEGGYKPLGEIRVGDLVVTHRNRLRPVLHKFERDTEEVLYTIKPKKLGFDDLRVTGDHKILTIRAEWINKHRSRDGLRLSQEPQWLPAKELRAGDFLAVAYNGEECPPEPIFLTDYLPETYTEQAGKVGKQTTGGAHGYVQDWGTHFSLNNRLELDDDLLYLFGRWLGDGCVTHRTKSDIPSGIKIVFALDELAEAEHIAQIIEDKFGIAASITLSSTGRWYDLWVNSMPMGQFFKAFLGVYSYGKRIPEQLMHLPRELTVSLLRGLFSADGYTSGTQLGIVLSNRVMATQVHHLLLRMGFFFSIKENTHRLGKTPAYRISANASECAELFGAFFDRTPPDEDGGFKAYIEYNDLRWVRIDAIETADYRGVVMDVEVAEDHSFVSAGVVVSNCYVIPSPKDSRTGIIETLRQMTEIMSRGGGVGINISSLRPRHAYVKGVNGRSSGSVSWGALYSFVTGLIEQGGCFGPNERILTDKGLIPAAELAERMDAGETFRAHTHEGLRPITARFRNGVKPLYDVTTERGYKVQITADHKVAVYMDGQIVTMALRYLVPGDEILLLLGQGVDISTELTVETASLLGQQAGASAHRAVGATKLITTVSVPESVMRADYGVQSAFIAGWLKAQNGSAGTDFVLSSTDREPLADIQQLLALNGIISTLAAEIDPAAGYSLTIDEAPYNVRMNDFLNGTSLSSTIPAPLTVADQIVSITPVGDSEVYDFEVETTHLISGNGIYTSNSRRGALMLILDDWHPDVFDFINSKREAGKITNANISVGVSDTLMELIKTDGDWPLIFPDTHHPKYDEEWDGNLEAWQAKGYPVITHRTVKARKVWDAIIESAWASAEPGVFFRERYNKMSNSWYHSPIIATNPCVTGDTLVSTEHGYTRARDLEVGMRIRTPAGLKPIEKIYNNGVQKIYRVQLSDGGHLDATADHKLKVVRGKKYEWVALSDLQKGDKVAVAANTAFGKRRRLPAEAAAYVQKRQLHVAPYFDRRLGFLVGTALGDGTLRQLKSRDSYSNSLKIAFGTKEERWLETFETLVEDMGIHTHRYVNEKDIALPDGTLVKHRAISLDCYKLATLLVKLGLPPNVKAPQKRIPRRFMSLDRRFLAGLLDGLFSTDGNVLLKRDNPMLRFTTASHVLAQQVRLILLQFGIHGRIYRSERKAAMYDGRSMIGIGHKFDVVIMNEGIAKFYSHIGLTNPIKAERVKDIAENWHFIGGSWLADVVSVNDTGREEEVFDVYEPHTLTWVTNGYISLDCGEQGLPGFGVCNLGAINLAKFYDETRHDVNWDDLDKAVRYATRFLDNVIDSTPYFFDENAKQQLGERRVGLNNMGLAELMIRLGIRYGSDESVAFIDKLYAFIARASYETSAELSAEKGAFPLFDAEKFLQSGFMESMPGDIRDLVRRKGIRNVTLLTQAPTGTTGTMVNTSTGIEPFFSWIYYRKSRLGLHEEQVPLVKEWYDAHPSATALPDHFVTAMDLAPEEHVKVQAAIQRWVDSSISKTSNLPNHYTVDQTRKLYEYMYELGCKGGTVYRDGSRDEQVLMLKGDERAEAEMADLKKDAAVPMPAVVEAATPHRVYPRPKRLTGVTASTNTPFGRAYITMNHDENGYPFEVFITAPGKAGSDLQADAEGLGRMISLQLRTTAPVNRMQMLKLIIDQLKDIGGARSYGMGPNRVLSLPDAVAGALLETYFPEEKAQQLSLFNGEANGSGANGNGHPPAEAAPPPNVTLSEVAPSNGHAQVMAGADLCPSCATISLIRVEGCRKCLTCGYSEC